MAKDYEQRTSISCDVDEVSQALAAGRPLRGAAWIMDTLTLSVHVHRAARLFGRPSRQYLVLRVLIIHLTSRHDRKAGSSVGNPRILPKSPRPGDFIYSSTSARSQAPFTRGFQRKQAIAARSWPHTLSPVELSLFPFCLHSWFEQDNNLARSLI